MTAQPYATDLSDAEWRILAPRLEPSTRHGRPRQHDRRVVLNAVLYVLRQGVPWRLLPHEFPPWRSVYDQFWRDQPPFGGPVGLLVHCGRGPDPANWSTL